jgi:antitoxin component of MazEF toxin-antitoxin module
METTLQLASWGGSTALRIPKNFLQQLNMTEKTSVKIKINNNNELVITAVYRHKTLEERFKDWDGTPYKLTDEDKEWLNMEEIGKERQ